MIKMGDTIFALSTAFSKSGIAVIRISGPNSLRVLEHFSIQKEIKPRVATFAKLHDKDHQLIDEGIILHFPMPHSFTGEDVIELQLHGSKAVIKTVLEELSKIFVMAKPGEFSLRAFLNNKLSLTAAEGLADLIDAETKVQAKQALRQMSGELDALYQEWRQKLINLQSNVEAYIDFPEDIEDSVLKELGKEIQNLIKSLKNHLNDERKGERLREGLHAVIIGEPNVGKSTLFNCLAKRDIAITSQYAGTTRDVLEAHIDIGGYPIIISDTAGIRSSSDPIECEGIARAKKKVSTADIKIALFDKLNSLDSETLSLVDEQTICVISKADSQDSDFLSISDRNFLPISVHKNKGINRLIESIKDKAQTTLTCSNEPVITRQRHRNCVQKALEYLLLFDIKKPIELISEDLRLATRELGKIVGAIGADEILGNIFSKFCLGK